MYLALLQISSSTTGPGLLSPAALLFNRPSRSILPKLSRPSILFNQDYYQYDLLIKSDQRLIRYKILAENLSLFTGATE